MSEIVLQKSPQAQLLERMVAARQLSALDAKALGNTKPSMQSEEDVLRWLAGEYGLTFTTLEDVDPDRQLLSLFPARLLLKEELLPIGVAINRKAVAGVSPADAGLVVHLLEKVIANLEGP